MDVHHGHVFFSLLLRLLALLVKSSLTYGDAFNISDPERMARARLYRDLEASPVLQNRLVPLSQNSLVNVRILLNLYKVGGTMSVFRFFILQPLSMI